MAVRQVSFVILIVATMSGGLVMAPVAAAALVCPDTTASDSPRTASTLREIYSGTTDMTASNRLGELVTGFRESGMKPALIVDHLIGAYCPLAAADHTLSDKQKADRVRQFAQQVTGLAYAGPDELDVLVTIPLTPTLLGQVDQAAGRAGLSRDAWLERAIRQQLTVP